ncbi:LexA family transcriptional regulator [uncultured Sunxiuqinia sp.]|uniref:XRE family transcriptional regulator n=1 Tax=uncultured Sunxiuqinia sp. TaxID=1573825 RepID=UPI002627F3D3|nr:LexA family transcriptional regulator [uncultured Sunxiuqinia sp.]
MNFLAQNIKYLRRKKKWTQQQLADELEVKRALIGSYEEGRATPKIPVLQRLAALSESTIDRLLDTPLEAERALSKAMPRILPIVVDQDNEELIPIVPAKASAGYLSGFADPEYVGALPRFYMPIPELSRTATYRVFQVRGDSMLPVTPESYLFCEYVSDINDLREGQPYVLITREEGLVYKRVYFKTGDQLLLKSDNPAYEPYSLDMEQVLELWKARGVLSFELPKPENIEAAHISSVLNEVKEEIKRLRKS